MAKLDRYDRIEIINSLMRKIGDTGRGFLYSQRFNRYAYFSYDGRTLYFIDHYTGVPLKMIKNSSHKTTKHQQYFSSGGTMWGLVNDFKDFIYGDDDSNHNNGYGGLYCPHWGYPEKDMEAIREYAKEIGYLPSKLI